MATAGLCQQLGYIISIAKLSVANSSDAVGFINAARLGAIAFSLSIANTVFLKRRLLESVVCYWISGSIGFRSPSCPGRNEQCIPIRGVWNGEGACWY